MDTTITGRRLPRLSLLPDRHRRLPHWRGEEHRDGRRARRPSTAWTGCTRTGCHGAARRLAEAGVLPLTECFFALLFASCFPFSLSHILFTPPLSLILFSPPRSRFPSRVLLYCCAAALNRCFCFLIYDTLNIPFNLQITFPSNYSTQLSILLAISFRYFLHVK